MELTATVVFPEVLDFFQTTGAPDVESIARMVTEVSAKMLPSCPADALPANLLAQAVKTA